MSFRFLNSNQRNLNSIEITFRFLNFSGVFACLVIAISDVLTNFNRV
jgi:hypothetical protein